MASRIPGCLASCLCDNRRLCLSECACVPCTRPDTNTIPATHPNSIHAHSPNPPSQIGLIMVDKVQTLVQFNDRWGRSWIGLLTAWWRLVGRLGHAGPGRGGVVGSPDMMDLAPAATHSGALITHMCCAMPTPGTTPSGPRARRETSATAAAAAALCRACCGGRPARRRSVQLRPTRPRRLEAMMRRSKVV